MADATSGKPLTILHLTMGAVLGGVTRYICDLSKGLQTMGHRAIAGGAPGPWEDLFRQEGIEWTPLPLDGGIRELWKAAGLVRNITQDRGVDIIHCHFRRPLLACRMGRWRGLPHIPIVYTLHLAPIPIGGLAHRLAGFGDHVIAPAEEGRRWIIETAHVPEQEVTLVPHGIDLAKWRPGTAADREAARTHLGMRPRTMVAFVGRFEYPKNEQWVLDLAVACRKQGLDVGFVMCGDGPDAPAVRSRIERDGLTGTVKLLGYTDPLPIYRAADMVVLPSAIEGFGYVAAEAAACGVAVLRTRTAGWQETVIDGETGQVVEIDRDAFLAAGLRMLSSLESLRKMGNAGTVMAAEHLDLHEQVRKTVEVYHRLLDGHGRHDRKVTMP